MNTYTSAIPRASSPLAQYAFSASKLFSPPSATSTPAGKLLLDPALQKGTDRDTILTERVGEDEQGRGRRSRAPSPPILFKLPMREKTPPPVPVDNTNHAAPALSTKAQPSIILHEVDMGTPIPVQSKERTIEYEGGQDRHRGRSNADDDDENEAVDVARAASAEQMAGRRIAPMRARVPCTGGMAGRVWRMFLRG